MHSIYRKKPTETDTFHTGAFRLRYAAHWRNGKDITTPPFTLSIPSLFFLKKAQGLAFSVSICTKTVYNMIGGTSIMNNDLS